ncbi:hydrogen-transporting ATP rotational mechanism [Chlorella sorokiniana]|uniref:Hydrogen-transporting ATP rotational mechanism n=1 Tax=Chlorella sorokiniana TaxID=3076 RepID=A0A2P6TMH4_CHLSO|nr:hydrogen-transporting ATP rotational mechanism [Chlorella sorokiniana]|eukprot:PRW45526.1 hydrogen-transporting ATP rotational mechanism [Chlorella sorokiniana]
MAARLTALWSKARSATEPAVKVASKEVASRYEQLMANNAQYVVKDKAAADKLAKQLFFTQLSKIPATMAECKTEYAALRSRLAGWRELPTTEMALYAGFAAEIYAWFCIGEIVGRGGSLTGYSV